MDVSTPLPEEAVNSLAMALIESSSTPLILLDDDLEVIAASSSFCATFEIDPEIITGKKFAGIGKGEWSAPQLESLLRVTIAGDAPIDAYEMDLVREGQEVHRLVVSAHKLDYFDTDKVRVAVAVTDLTEALAAAKRKDDLVREKEILLQELQHRVANSLQIIASVLMQSARRVQSDETRAHLHDAHHRVMSIATLQKQLAVTQLGKVELRPYFRDLCQSIGASMISDPKRLVLTARADDSSVSADESVSLGLIITELVINALKHAFPGRDRTGEIDVDYAAAGTSWTLTVRDNGVGMPARDPTPGLGTGIVDALAKQLGATVDIVRTNPGTTVRIAHA